MKLRDFCFFLNGGTPTKAVPAYFDGDIPWITGADITGPIVTRARSHITEEAIDESATNRVPKGTILLVTRTSVGKVGIAGVDLCFSQDITAVLPDPEKADTGFLVHFLRTKQPHFEDNARGATIKGITRQVVADLELPLPPLEDQKRIAALLDKADALRRKRQEALRLTDDFLRATFLDLFGGYLDKNASDPFADVLAMPLNNGFFAKNDQYGSGTPVIWVDNLYHTSLINTSSLRRAEMTANDLRKYAVLEGDLLFTRSSLVRDGIGQCNVVPSLAEPMAFECHIIRARVDLKKANPRYIQALYRSDFGKAEILRRANTATMTTISQGSLEALPCPLPPIELQNRFAAIVQAVEKTASSMAATLESNNTLFSALQQRAFSGEL